MKLVMRLGELIEWVVGGQRSPKATCVRAMSSVWVCSCSGVFGVFVRGREVF